MSNDDMGFNGDSKGSDWNDDDEDFGEYFNEMMRRRQQRSEAYESKYIRNSEESELGSHYTPRKKKARKRPPQGHSSQRSSSRSGSSRIKSSEAASRSRTSQRGSSPKKSSYQGAARERARSAEYHSAAKRSANSRSENYGSVRSAQSRSSSGKRKRKVKQAYPKRAVAVPIVCMCIIVFVVLSSSLDKLMNASLFSGSEDESVIQERLITSEENQDKVTYFLIVGVDKSSMLTDCIWILCFDNEAHEMNVMQIPRDTYVGTENAYPYKINSIYGNPKTVDWCETCQTSVDEDEVVDGVHTVCGTEVEQKTESNMSALIRYINTNLGIPIDHYILFDFDGFEAVVDAMGGVDITLDEDLRVYPSKSEYYTLPAGENHLDGATALDFMRNRQAYSDGDLGRIKAQRQIIYAMLEKVMDMSSLNILSLITAAYGNFSTDMSLADIRSFINPLKNCTSDSLNMFELPGYSYWAEPHSSHQSYYVCDAEAALEAINTYLMPYGDKLTIDDILFPNPADDGN